MSTSTRPLNPDAIEFDAVADATPILIAASDGRIHDDLINHIARGLIPRLEAIAELNDPLPKPEPSPAALRFRLKREIANLEGEFEELREHATAIFGELEDARRELARLERLERDRPWKATP